MNTGPFHTDELAAQSLAGEGSAGGGIRPFMPDQHRAFFGLLPYLFVATADADGWPVATVVHGLPGFVTAVDATLLRVEAQPEADDPASPVLDEGNAIGLLGLDLSTRRRNRANGIVTVRDRTGFSVAITQSFGNCPQYIQVRQPVSRPRAGAAIEPLATLDARARALIATADTFFVASRSRPSIHAGAGLDISHRGGQPGFIDLRGDSLVIPDFHGNRYFNTLGNLLGDPRAALLFLDFATGDVLQLQGKVSIDWTGRSAAAVTGAERSWQFDIERTWRRPAALPFSWSAVTFAPTTLRTGVWPTPR